MLEQFDKDNDKIKHNVARISWYMRGGASLSELYEMGMSDQKILSNVIEENLETAKKTGQPFW
jgi:hypothetical protein